MLVTETFMWHSSLFSPMNLTTSRGLKKVLQTGSDYRVKQTKWTWSIVVVCVIIRTLWRSKSLALVAYNQLECQVCILHRAKLRNITGNLDLNDKSIFNFSTSNCLYRVCCISMGLGSASSCLVCI